MCIGIVIPGFSQATFEAEEGDSIELCVDISSASVERSVVLMLSSINIAAQGT